MSEPLVVPEPKTNLPEKLALIVPEVSATVAEALVNEIPLTLKVPLVTLAVQLFAAR